MPWLATALLTAAAFGLYNVFMKLGADRIDAVLGAVVLQVVAAALGSGYALWLRTTDHSFAFSREGLGYAAAAGVCVGLAEIGTFVVFARGAPVALATPIILGGSVTLAALVGATILREPLRPTQIAGIVLVICGVALVSSGVRR